MKYEGHYTVRADEVTPDKKMSVPAMIRLMQEGSMQNSLEHHFSVWDMEPHNISWVLLRKKMVINRYPELSDVIKVVTYPITTERILAYRDYKLYDSNDHLLAYASSTWTVINLTTRKLVRIPEKYKDMVAPGDEEILEPPESKNIKLNSVDFTKNFRPNYFDTDWNDHVNNIYFIRSMIESTPLDIIKSKQIEELIYSIKSECLLGEELNIEGEIDEDSIIRYKVSNSPGGKTMATGEIKWT